MFMFFFMFYFYASVQIKADSIETTGHIQRGEQTQTIEYDLLNELEIKTEDIIVRSKTTVEDMNKEASVPLWKKWVIQAGDIMYWTYQTSLNAVQALYNGCKNALTGASYESQKKST